MLESVSWMVKRTSIVFKHKPLISNQCKFLCIKLLAISASLSSQPCAFSFWVENSGQSFRLWDAKSILSSSLYLEVIFIDSLIFCCSCPVRYSLKAQIGFLVRESMKKVPLLQKLLLVKLTLTDLMTFATWIGFPLTMIWMKRMFSKGMYLKCALSLQHFDAFSIYPYMFGVPFGPFLSAYNGYHFVWLFTAFWFVSFWKSWAVPVRLP